MEKKKKLIILGVILLLIIVSGATFAILTWNSTMIKLGINTNCFTIDYTRGGDITGSLKLMDLEDIFSGEDNTFTIKKGMGLSYVNVGINSNCSIEGYGTIYLNVTELSDTFKDGGDSYNALAYAILKNTSNLSNNDITIDNLENQSFELVNGGVITDIGKVTLLEEQLSNTEVNKYLVVIFIIKQAAGNDVTEATFKGNISVEANQENEYVSTPDYCFELSNEDEENKTASIKNYNCYEGNSKGYETITDVAIPNMIGDYKITGIVFDFMTCHKYNRCSFYNMGLTSIIIPASIVTIEQNAILDNPLKYIIVNSRNPVYDSRDNSNAIIETASNNLIKGSKNTIIPNTVTMIEFAAFRSLELTNISIPDSVTTIGDYAFSSNQLTSVTISDSVTTIGNGTFQYNNLNHVYIGNNSKLTNIGSEAFSSSNYSNPNLKTIYYNGSNSLPWINAINGSDSDTKFVTGTVSSYTSSSGIYNEVLITTGK